MLTPVYLLRALHWRPFESGIACLVQLDANTEPWKTPGILPRIAAEYLWIVNKFKGTNHLSKGEGCWIDSSVREKAVACNFSKTPMATTQNSKEVRNDLLVASGCSADRSSLSPMQLMLLMEETSSNAMKISQPVPVDNMAFGKALKRFLAEPVLVGILMLQYAAVIIVVLVISLSETH